MNCGAPLAHPGARCLKPGNCAKSRSRLIHSQPCSIASPAYHASATSLARAFTAKQRPLNISQCRTPGSIARQFGRASSESQNAKASAADEGCLYARGVVVMRMRPLSVSGETAKGVSRQPCIASFMLGHLGWERVHQHVYVGKNHSDSLNPPVRLSMSMSSASMIS